MSYISLRFVALIAVSLLAYYLCPKNNRWVALLVTSLAFYVICSKWLTLAMAATTLWAYLIGAFIGMVNNSFSEKKKLAQSKDEKTALKSATKKKKKALLSLGVVVLVCMLLVFKYCGFFAGIFKDTVNAFGGSATFAMPHFVLPLGISYYTLSLIGYITDVYRGTIKAEKSYFALLLFTCFFPHIVEGPIASYSNLAPQLREGHSIDYEKFVDGIVLILYGLVKKMILADRLAVISNEVFDNSANYTGAPVLIALVSYTGCIYADFSGCIDMVSGVSELFGIKLAENFRRPFFSRSVQEFWRRWHITLGAWIKSYVFYPVSLSKPTQKLSKSLRKHMKSDYFSTTIPMLFSLFFVWFVNGFWHGANWKYILYGLYYYVILALGLLLEPLFAKFCARLKINRESRGYRVFQIIRTDILVIIGLTIFRADYFTTAIKILRSAFVPQLNLGELYTNINASLSILDFPVIALAAVLVIWVSCREESDRNVRKELSEKPNVRWVLCTVAVMAVILWGVYGSSYTAQPFVYGQF